MSKKQPFHFNISSQDKVEWDVWHELMLNNDMNSSFFGFNAGHSAWGDILKILDEEIFTHSDLYKLELFGPATRIDHSSWPTDIDEDGEFGQIGANLCSVNNFEILPDDHDKQLYYVYQSIEEGDLLEFGIFSSKVLFIPNEIILNKDGRQKNISFKDLDYSDCYANIHKWTEMATKGVNPTKKDMFSSWITPHFFYSSFYGLSEISKNEPLYGLNEEKPFPFYLKIHKYKDGDDELLTLDSIRDAMLHLSSALDVPIYGFFFCEEEKFKNSTNLDYDINKDLKEKKMALDTNKIHRIAIEDDKDIVLNMVYAEVAVEDSYEVFGAYAGNTREGPQAGYFHQDLEGEFTVSDDFFEFETSLEPNLVCDELDDLRNEFEDWDEDGDLIGFSDAGKDFLKSNESVNDDGYIEAYSESASDDFIYGVQDEWRVEVYK